MRPLSELGWQEVCLAFRAAGVDLPPGLITPSFHISYRRSRFVARADGLRVALDDQIRVTRAHPRYASGLALARAPLRWAVLEVKGPHRRMPRALQCLYDLGVRRSAFSKYGILATASEVA